MSAVRRSARSVQPAQPKTLADALRGVATRTRIRDDGSCWVYSVLACVGLCEHAQPAPFGPMFRRQPSVRDIQLDHAVRMWLSEEAGEPGEFLRVPDYSEQRGDFMGSGGYARDAARALGVGIIEVFDESGAHGRSVLDQIALHRQLHPEQPLAIVAFSADLAPDEPTGHYEAYVLIDQPAFIAPPWLVVALAVASVENVVGWMLQSPRAVADTTSCAVEPDGSFQIDSIVAWRLCASGDKDILVRWVGWDEPTWEPCGNIPHSLVKKAMFA